MVVFCEDAATADVARTGVQNFIDARHIDVCDDKELADVVLSEMADEPARYALVGVWLAAAPSWCGVSILRRVRAIRGCMAPILVVGCDELTWLVQTAFDYLSLTEPHAAYIKAVAFVDGLRQSASRLDPLASDEERRQICRRFYTQEGLVATALEWAARDGARAPLACVALKAAIQRVWLPHAHGKASQELIRLCGEIDRNGGSVVSSIGSAEARDRVLWAAARAQAAKGAADLRHAMPDAATRSAIRVVEGAFLDGAIDANSTRRMLETVCTKADRRNLLQVATAFLTTAKPAGAAPKPISPNATVWFVDDEHDRSGWGDVLRTCLHPLGYAVRCFPEGQFTTPAQLERELFEALSMEPAAASDQPDVLLLDMSFGAESPEFGLLLLERLYEEEDRYDIPVVMLTLANDVSLQRACLRRGAVAYFAKELTGDPGSRNPLENFRKLRRVLADAVRDRAIHSLWRRIRCIAMAGCVETIKRADDCSCACRLGRLLGDCDRALREAYFALTVHQYDPRARLFRANSGASSAVVMCGALVERVVTELAGAPGRAVGTVKESVNVARDSGYLGGVGGITPNEMARRLNEVWHRRNAVVHQQKAWDRATAGKCLDWSIDLVVSVALTVERRIRTERGQGAC